ncbi:MAG TPA: mechanosensitive ion channel domain-containing protein [Vicinamibacterales bacterium]|nr:mechanosensitive ion channel domain-containing protein [Vicinamibacterales bacterium]
MRYPAVVVIVAAFLLATVVVRVAHAIIHRALDALDIVSAENRAAVHARGQQLMRALTVLAYGVAALAAMTFALERFGVAEPQWHPRQILHWVLTHGVNIVAIAIAAYIVVRSANLGIEHLQYKLGKRHAEADLEWQRRAATLGGILTSLVTAATGFLAGLMVLRELSIDVLPLLTGAGIAGLAIGFGAQNLVRDVISGFFLILEDQVRVGDSVRINGTPGTVEQINLRTIVMRDGDGAVQVFPNGTVTSLANLSKQYAFAIVDIKVAYTESLDRALGTIREVGDTMEKDAVFGPLLLGSLEVVGVDSLADTAASVRVKFRTLPLSQSRVANELRRRLVTAFIGRHIKPYG